MALFSFLSKPQEPQDAFRLPASGKIYVMQESPRYAEAKEAVQNGQFEIYACHAGKIWILTLTAFPHVVIVETIGSIDQDREPSLVIRSVVYSDTEKLTECAGEVAELYARG